MGKSKGNTHALYVKAGDAPSNPDQIGEYALVGNRKGTGISSAASSVDLTDSGSAAAENEPGIPKHTLSGTFNADHAGDAGQNILRTANKTQAQVHWLLTPISSASAQVAGKLQHRGLGTVAAYDQTHPHEGPSECTVTIDVDGQYTTETVAT